ncbi:MAG: protoporphyrinogen oxidase [Verrucomicrobiota bacterium]
MTKNIIIGAGVTGLSVAWHLKKAGHEVTVLEKSPVPGGSVKTIHDGQCLVEAGPNTLMLNDQRVMDLLREIGLEDQIVETSPVAKKRFLAKDGVAHPAPSSPLALLKTPLLSSAGKWRLLQEPLIPKRASAEEKEETLADFVRRRLGPEAYEQFFQPLVSGIYAGDPEKLSLGGTFPFLKQLEEEQGSLFMGMLKRKKSKHAIKRQLISFQRGLGQMIEAFASEVGEDLHCGAEIEEIIPDGDQGWKVAWTSEKGNESRSEVGKLILTVPAHTVARLPLPVDLLSQVRGLAEIPHPALVSVSCLCPCDAISHPLDGFGMLIPSTETQPVLGTLFISSLFPQRCPPDQVLLTSFIGGRTQPERAGRDDETLQGFVRAVLQDYLGLSGEPVKWWINRWPQSIPQPEQDHSRILEQIDQVESEWDHLHFIGNYRQGVSLPQCLLSGYELAEALNHA